MVGQLDALLGLDAAVAADVAQGDVVVGGEDAADEQAPVAVLGVLFAAEQGDAAMPGQLEEPFDAAPKSRGRCDEVVADVALVVVEVVLRRAAPELGAQEGVLDAHQFQAPGQVPPVVPGGVRRPRHRAHVGDDLHAVVDQQRTQVFGAVVGVTDGVDLARTGGTPGGSHVGQPRPFRRRRARSRGRPR